MLAHDVTLIDVSITYDSIGQEITSETETVIQAELSAVSRSEFYQAASAGLKPELVLLVHEFEYGLQNLIKFEGVYYSVIRTYPVTRYGLHMTELVCERKLGV